MKLLLIKGMPVAHPYSHFAWALRDALLELGHEAVISDHSAHASEGAAPTGPLVSDLQSVKPDAVVSFSSFFGSVTLNNGMSLFDYLGVKFVGWQLDHPIYAPQSLRPRIEGRHAIYSNHNHLRYAQAVKVEGHAVTMLPGGNLPAAPTKAYGDRQWPVFVAATWNGVPTRHWEAAEDSPGKHLMAGVVAALEQDPEASLLDAFNLTAARMQLGARLGDDPDFDEMMRDFLREPLNYVRNMDRINVVRSLVEAGLPVTICGQGWDALFADRRNVTYLDRVGFGELAAYYGDAKVVLNLNASNGACERAVEAALAGAAVASDYGVELEALLGAEQGVAFFDRTRPASVAEVVAGLLEGGEGEALAARGHAAVARSGLWRRRAEDLVAYIQET